MCNFHHFYKLHDPSQDEFDLVLLLLSLSQSAQRDPILLQCVEASEPEMIMGNALQVDMA